MNLAFAEVETTGLVTEAAAVSGQEARGLLQQPAVTRFVPEEVGGYLRAFDAERKLLEAIAARLPLGAQGTIRLFSEYQICTSCTSVIAQFQRRFPGVKLVFSSGPRPVGL